MLVKEIIEHSIWLPSSDYERYKPKVSILLPAYAKAKSGLFKKVMNSILGQTFQEFELIIVDDASTDGTKEIIDAYMRRDMRISCIRHPYNVGLPAISEYEAFMKSSGEYILFAFDDFVFEKKAIQELYEIVTKNDYVCCYGQARSYYYEKGVEKFVILGKPSVFGNGNSNYVANSSVILKRNVLETVGLYDPHILMTRECDFDLWQRISKHYYLQKVEVMVGSEHGVTQDNSLGNSYLDTRAVSSSYKMQHRDEQLLPANFAEKNIIELPHFFGSKERTYVEDLLDFYQSKFWAKNIKSNKKTLGKKIAFYTADATNYHLCFESINHSEHYKIVQVKLSYNILQDLYLLMAYDAVIINRNLVHSAKLIGLLKRLEIPCYYYIDDNFIALKEEFVELAWYSEANTVQTLKDVNAVLTSTEILKEFFLKKKIHSKVFCYPPILNKTLLPATSDEGLQLVNKSKKINIAVIGGLFRRECFIKYVVPALNKLTKAGEVIHLTVRKEMLLDGVECQFPVHEIDSLEDYNQYIHQLREKEINIIIHPFGNTANSIYKTNSVLLNTLYLNSNIIVFGEPAFEKLDEKDGIINIKPGINSIIDAINYLSISSNAERLKSNLKNYCYKAFNMETNIQLLNFLTQDVEMVNTVIYEQRMKLLINNISEKADFYQESSASLSLSKKAAYQSIQHCFDCLIKGIQNNENIPQFKTTLARLKYKENGKGLTLKKGLSLNKKIFREYHLKNFNETLSEITIACAGTTNKSSGSIGIELILPGSVIALHCTKPLNEVDLLAPITFNFPTIRVPSNTTLILRIFLKDSDAPISVYEWRVQPLLIRNRKRQPFCMLS